MEKMRILAFVTVICGVALMSIPAAFANHCPGEFGSRCCYRQSPNPAWPRTPGGYYVCDWPDDCHIRCYQEYNRADELTQTVDYRPENIVPGTCQAFVDHAIKIGIVQPTNDGSTTENVPRQAGYTWHKKLKWDPRWNASQHVEPSGNGVNLCLTLKSLSVVFSWDMTQDVLRWSPPASTGLSQSCTDSYKRYLEATIAHENAHAAVAQSVAEYFNKSPNQPAFTTTVCAFARTEGEALSAARNKMDSTINAVLLDFYKRVIKPKLDEEDDKVEKYYIIPWPDCSLCGP